MKVSMLIDIPFEFNRLFIKHRGCEFPRAFLAQRCRRGDR
jgi:hypothetical protein